MEYREAVDYILEIPKFTKKNKPEHTKAFLGYLGNPERNLKVIHVAGTNGKGSVCAYLDAMLRAEGKRVGLFTSPHLVKPNERIVIDGEECSDERFLSVFEKVMEVVRVMEADGLFHPTFFEFLFGMAVTAFADAGVEYAVLETGLGGRLDATNAVEHPICSVITSIGWDHMALLGNTLEEIAAEKAGILKPGTPLFFFENGNGSDAVIENRAETLGISCKKIGKNAFKILGIEQKRIAFSCASAYYEDIIWSLHNTGIYQPENAMLALEVMRMLFGGDGKKERWRTALDDVVWAGRMEEVLPDVFVDGAHNLSAVERFAQSLEALDQCGNGQDAAGRMLLFSAVEDKDYEEMIACLCKRVEADVYVVTQITDSRAAGSDRLCETFRKYTEQPVLMFETLETAWNYLLENQGGRSIYCLGSLYLAGMIEELIQERGTLGCWIMKKN